MTISGTVQNGVVVLGEGQTLPEGASVQIVFVPPREHLADAPATPSIWDELARLGREVESLPCDLPEDLAINHDHYLYGAPKRQ
jgi:hypothetical protein